MFDVVKIEALDHVVVTVSDAARASVFYCEVLGFRPAPFGGAGRALRLGRQKLTLQELSQSGELRAGAPTPGSADLCFITATPLDQVADELKRQGVQIEKGPVEKMGALGRMFSLYIRDPDQNLVELSNYPRGQPASLPEQRPPK